MESKNTNDYFIAFLKDKNCSTALLSPRLLKSFLFAIGVYGMKKDKHFYFRFRSEFIGEPIPEDSFVDPHQLRAAVLMELYNAKMAKLSPNLVFTSEDVHSAKFSIFSNYSLGALYGILRR